MPFRSETTESNSTLVSRNVTVNGRRTSVRLEPEMWDALREITLRESCGLHDLCSLIYDHKVESSSFTAAIRVFLMSYFRSAATDEGHRLVGHGNMPIAEGIHRFFEQKQNGLSVSPPNSGGVYT